jgi:four helix bundle protein
MNNYKDLKIWQKSVDLAVKVYEVTRLFPKEELYGLTYQLKKSAVSIPSNIAEGSGRNTKKDFNNFLGISYGSTCELNTQLIIASRINFLTKVDLNVLEREIDEIQRMNWALKKSLNLTQYSRL